MECRRMESGLRMHLALIRGLIAKGLIDKSEALVWLNNAISLVEEDKTVSQRNTDALSIIRGEMISLLE